jgi:hypothetical protein
MHAVLLTTFNNCPRWFSPIDGSLDEATSGDVVHVTVTLRDTTLYQFRMTERTHPENRMYKLIKNRRSDGTYFWDMRRYESDIRLCVSTNNEKRFFFADCDGGESSLLLRLTFPGEHEQVFVLIEDSFESLPEWKKADCLMTSAAADMARYRGMKRAGEGRLNSAVVSAVERLYASAKINYDRAMEIAQHLSLGDALLFHDAQKRNRNASCLEELVTKTADQNKRTGLKALNV